MKTNKIKVFILLFSLLAMAMLFAACNVQIKYKIDFYTDGVIYDTIDSDGQSISMPDDPTKPGYDFDGWFYDEDVWEEPFTLQSLLDQSLSEANHVKLYAKFIEKEYDYRVSFKDFEKIGDEYVIKISEGITEFNIGDKIVIDEKLTYVLSKDEDFSELLSSTVVSLNEGTNTFFVKVTNEYGQNKTYKLKIERNDVFTVTFDTHGGTLVAEQSVEDGRYAVPPTELPKKYGYVFLKWDFDFSTPITQNTTIKAVWEENFYKIQYQPNGGFGTMQESIVEVGTQFDLSPNTYERVGYTFIGWRFGTETFKDGENIFNLAAVGDAISLVAEWRANPYTVNFDKGDKSASGSMTAQTFVYDSAQNLARNNFYRKGHSFDGWAYNGKRYADGESVKNLAQSGTVTLTATWKPFEFTLKYEGNGATYGEPLTQKITYDSDFYVQYSPFERKGYTFLRWQTENGLELEPGDTISANIFLTADGTIQNGDEIILNAVWQANEYTVEYRMYNMGWYYSQTVFYDEEFALAECPEYFEKEGYVFDGWSVPNNGVCQPGDLVKNLTTDRSVKVYAQWREVSYTLTFDVLDGDCVPLDEVHVTYESAISFTRAEPVKEGYTFIGYHYQDNYLGKTGRGLRRLTTVDGAVLTLRALYRYDYSGSGTAEQPYILDTPESVTALSDFMLADYFENDAKGHNAYFQVVNDIDLQGAAISPICDLKEFGGVLDGNYFTISNFELRSGLKGYNEKNLGFVSQNFGTICNLRLKDFKVVAEGNTPNMGCVAGANSGFIDYCEVLGAELIVRTQQTIEEMMIGGYVGKTFNRVEKDSRINGCKFNGSFSIDGSNIQSLQFGGMIGGGNSNVKYCFVDYIANIINAKCITANTIAPSYDLTSDAISTLAMVNLTIDAEQITLNIQANDISDIYYSSGSSIVLRSKGTESYPLKDIELIDKDNYKDFNWVYENVTGFTLASWEFDGVNYPFVSNTPTKPAPRAISSAQDLLSLSGKRVSGMYYLTCDINLGGIEWIPFDLYGTFDGKGYKISNFKITNPTDEKTVSFIKENHGEILSLYLSNYSIVITPEKISGNPYTIYAGGLVAYNYGTIKFVKADGYIDIEMPTVFPNSKNAVVGGLVAVNYGDIYSSYVVADITVYSGKTLTIGGMVGSGDGGQIINCFTIGAIAGQSHDSSGASGGGIVGQSGAYQYTIVKNSFSNCNIRLIGNRYTAQVNTVSKYTENCYSALSQKIYYNGEELVFSDLSIVDDSNFKSKTYLKNRLNFDSYIDDTTLSGDYTKAWLFEDNELPKLYFE